MKKPNRYIHPQQVWDKDKCEKLCNRIAKDGLGTSYGFKGYVGDLIGTSTTYNGGCIRNGEWYIGEVFPLPKVPKGFKIITYATWGYRIIKVGNK